MSNLILNEIQVIRQKTLLEDVVIIDGQPGCGKTLFSAIVSAMDRVELLNYSPELENICALKYLDKITNDAASAMISIQMDLELYETMMSRNTNFRPKDLSSVFSDVNIFTYLKRLFLIGDEVIPERIKKEKPIMHFATHNLLGFIEPAFKSLGEKLKIIEVVRHPLYMLIQQTFNMSNQLKSDGSSRQFHLYIKHGKQQLAFWNLRQRELFLKSNAVDRAIYEMKILSDLSNNYKNKQDNIYLNQIMTIPFESFVLNPWPFINEIKNLINSKITKKTKRVIKKQNVPRQKISDGIPLAIYKRCGWEPPEKNLSEVEELEKRRQFAVDNNASSQALDVLEQLIEDYEKQYFSFKEN